MRYTTIQQDDQNQNLTKKQQQDEQYIDIQKRKQVQIYCKTHNFETKNHLKTFFLEKCTYSYYIITLIIGMIILISVKQNTDIEEKVAYQIYNEHLRGQKFGNFSELYIDLNQIIINNFSYKSQNPYYYNRIQVGSILDFGLTEIIDFDLVQKIMEEKLAYQLVYFQFNPSFEREIGQVARYFSNTQQIEHFLNSLKINSKQNQKSIQYNLALQIIKDQNNPKLNEAQYYLASKKYGIDEQKQQSSVCIYSAEFNIQKNKDRYKKYFYQIQNLNYTNFHIVYVDDFSQDDSFSQVYQFLKYSTLRIRNRIKIVHNLQKLGVLGNLNFWVNKYCRDDDIVVVIDADDGIIGKQVLKIINSVYKTPSIWYTYTKFILTHPKNLSDCSKGFVSTFLDYKTQEYRISLKWQTSLMRTFRKKLLDSIPLYSFIQYHYQKNLNIFWPCFYKYGGDMFMVYAQLQVAGNQRIAHIVDYLYLYYFQVASGCRREQQMHDGFKSNIKTPLNQVSKLGQKATLMRNYSIQQQTLKLVQKSYNDLLQCQKQKNSKNQKDQKIKNQNDEGY